MNKHLTVNTTTDQWEGTITCAKQNNTITLSTASQYVDKNIQLDIKVIKAVLTTSDIKGTSPPGFLDLLNISIFPW